MKIGTECINHNAVRGNSRKGGNMKYIIEFENATFHNMYPDGHFGCSTLYRAKGFNSLVFDQNGLDKLTPYDPDEAYQRGLKDAWTFAEHLVYISDDVTNSVYQSMNGGKGLLVAFGMPYEDAKKMYDEYFERKKKAEKEFQVGDEVENEDGETAYVLNPDYDGELILSVEKYTCPQRQSKTEWKKTGFRNENIAKLLGLEDAR